MYNEIQKMNTGIIFTIMNKLQSLALLSLKKFFYSCNSLKHLDLLTNILLYYIFIN